MCYNTKQTKDARELELRFQAQFAEGLLFEPQEVFNAFAYPRLPVIMNRDAHVIELPQWGLLPKWAPKDFPRNYTLNARLETLHEKRSFKDSVGNRCLVLVNGFYEWRHEGKVKVKYEIGYGGEAYALAGLYEEKDGLCTFTIVTTEAQGVMEYIHNTKRRMPLAMKEDEEMRMWLSGEVPEPRFDFETKPEVQQLRLF